TSEYNKGGSFITKAGLLLMVIGFFMAVPLAIYNLVTRINAKREHKRRMQEIDEMKKNMYDAFIIGYLRKTQEILL
ncbi:MAG: hypothetical protein J6S89_09140, partial [Paludibacteraceae bacterium]|nr:hypothetical protein [Paludibacteraceae bacterium]